ncbi:MAG: AtpZ/AtpI family protein [Candidatus Omnitrophica bacterium]|nr:AtpZ/AtpI family protein [Candidatus Omnitrophota bacterium]
MRQLGLWLTLPILLAVAPLVGLFAGQWVDRKFGCAPWGALILTFVGLAAGVVETQRLVKTAQRIQDTKK